MEKILIITSNDTSHLFKDFIKALGEYYVSYIVSSLGQAQNIVETGVDKVVMYPFYINIHGYPIAAEKDLRKFAGYYFWKKEIASKNIPTIVVDLRTLDDDQYSIQDIMNEDWKQHPQVTFLERIEGFVDWDKLVELIKL